MANIVPDENDQVWGAIWDVGMENMDSLDRQEGVHLNIYRPIDVNVKTPGGDTVLCRCYRLVQQLEAQDVDSVPRTLPSNVYLTTIINGAKETKLPAYYTKKLVDHPDNGYSGEVNLNLEQ